MRLRRGSPRPVRPRFVCRRVRISVDELSITRLYGAMPAYLDLTELDLPSTMKTNFPDPADLLNFTLTITPDEGA